MNRLALCWAALTLTGCFCTTVEPGHRGVVVVLGQVDPKPLSEGFHWVNPLASVKEVTVRQSTRDLTAECFSSDLQEMKFMIRVLYRIPEASTVKMYQEMAGEPFDTLVAPRVQEAIKEVTAVMTADHIVKQREQVKVKSLDSTRTKIGGLLIIEDLIVENIELSHELTKAIEQKMIQEQEAAKAKFIQQKAQVEAETAIIQAKGEAEAIRIRGDALKLNPAFIELRIVEKWDGKSPAVVGASGGPSMLLPMEAKQR
ncbi:MAG: prohibitin family protein [Myxococcales bacterium]|nr:prohibitin family protein [Myxococcales bacterium]